MTQELTAQRALVILNTHIDDVVKGTCGQGKDEPSWGLNEINSIINCIATIKIRLDKADTDEKALLEMQATLSEPVVEKTTLKKEK